MQQQHLSNQPADNIEGNIEGHHQGKKESTQNSWDQKMSGKKERKGIRSFINGAGRIFLATFEHTVDQNPYKGPR